MNKLMLFLIMLVIIATNLKQGGDLGVYIIGGYGGHKDEDTKPLKVSVTVNDSESFNLELGTTCLDLLELFPYKTLCTESTKNGNFNLF